MDWVMPAISIASGIFALAAFLRISSINHRIQRLRKRYDYLLRGRGEVNLEELIVKFGEELDEVIGQQRSDTQKIGAIHQRMEQEFQEQRADWTTMVREQDRRLSDRLDELDARLSDGLAELSHSTDRRMRKMEEDNYVRFDGVQKELVSTNQDWSQSVAALQAKTEADLNREALLLRESLSLAIQKVALYRYNAFEDLAGEQSYSLALLDEHGDGILLTNIYGRRGSSNFSKEIRAGRPLQGLSPEEETVLKQALGERRA